MESAEATTTAEEDRHTAGQRNINLIWEVTQAVIAIAVVIANLVGAFYLPDQNPLLSNGFFLIIGFYFGRTNHARLGGVVQGRVFDR